MGALIIIVPIVIYYYLIKWLFNKYYKDTNKTKRKIYFILLITLPFWDHIAGYAYYKYLCFSKGGITIYKTVTDLQEQRDYWLRGFKQYSAPSTNGERYGITSYVGLTKDLKEHKVVYINNCKSKRWKTYDCKKAEEYIKEHNIKIHKMILFDDNILEAIDRRKEIVTLEAISLIDKDKLEPAYFNYCNKTYDNLPITDPNCKKSCKYTDTIIEKYNLKNVIKVPKSPYSMYVSNFDKNYNSNIPIFFIRNNIGKIYDKNSNDILAEYNEYGFGGGWYIQTISPYPFASYCGDTSLSSFKEQVIPNPYKQNRK